MVSFERLCDMHLLRLLTVESLVINNALDFWEAKLTLSNHSEVTRALKGRTRSIVALLSALLVAHMILD